MASHTIAGSHLNGDRLILAQSSDYTWERSPSYVDDYSYFGIFGLFLALVPPAIVAYKGYGWADQFIYLIWGCACWPLALVWALSKPNLKLERLEQEQATRNFEVSRRVASLQDQVADLQWQLERSKQTDEGFASAPGQGLPDVPAEVQTCPNCHAVCPHDLLVCWQCNRPMKQNSQRQKADDQRPMLKSAHVPDQPDLLRVECNACKRHFSGAKGKIAVIRKCPRCGAVPFDYRLLPSKTQ